MQRTFMPWAALACGAMLLSAAPAWAQVPAENYPSRPVSIVVGWSPGGATDLLARQLAEVMAREAGQSFIVENKAGANGTIGHSQAARARADGYTSLLATNSTFAIAPHLYAKLPFDQQRDLAPVSLIAESPLVLVSSTALGSQTLNALLDKAKAQEGGLNVASGGNGSTSHMAAEMLMALTGATMTHVPYKGGGPATTAVAAGEVDAAFLDLGVALPFLQSGRVTALGVTSAQRSPLLPEVPTLQEAGVADFVATTTFGLFAPAATPEAVTARLSTLAQAALRDETLLAKLKAQGVVVHGTDAAQLATYTQEESARWARVIAERGIRLD